MKYVLLALLLTACTYDAGTVGPGQVLDCKDFRDGETFTIRSENMGNFRGGIGTDSCISGRDDNGKERTLCSSMQQFIKCEKRALTAWIPPEQAWDQALGAQ